VHHFRRLVPIVTACLVLAPFALNGQAPGGQTQLPTFRAEARAIEVDVHVTDPQGRFVRGLTREDFEILEDGQRQDISAFTLVDVPVESPTAQTGQKRKASTFDTDVFTNDTNGRIYVMLLDTWGVSVSKNATVTRSAMFRFTQRVAVRFVDEALGASDMMAVIHVQDSRSDAQAFTSNKGLLRAAINRLKPDVDGSEDLVNPPLCDVPKLRNSYEMLETVSQRLGAMTGRRKAIIWVNGRVPFDPSDPVECGDMGAGGGSLTFMQRDAMRAATRNNVAIYPIDSIGLNADASRNEPAQLRLLRQAALRGIAEDTGGDAILNTNNFGPAFERIVRAHSTYYLLGYRPTQDHRDGQFHSITVRVRRPNLTVRARKGYRAPEPGEPLEARLLPRVSAAAGEMLVRSLPSSGLGLQLFLAPFRGVGREASVLLGAEVNGLTREGVAEPRVEISYLAIDAQGATRVAPPKTLPLDSPDAADAAGVRYVDRLLLPPGRHELRIAMHQNGGETGSIVTHVDVPDFTRAPLTMSGMVLVAAASAPLVLVGDAGLKGTPAATSTTRRRFSRTETTITALVEVYSDSKTPVESVTMTSTILDARGTKVRTETPTRPSVEPGRAGYTVRLPLAELAPGDYVLTMEAKAGRRSSVRQVPFSVTE
jgi:VWFA-related protein